MRVPIIPRVVGHDPDRPLPGKRTGADRVEAGEDLGEAGVFIDPKVAHVYDENDRRVPLRYYRKIRFRYLDDTGAGSGPEGTVVYWNESAARLYGWRPSEAVGGPMIETVDPVMPVGDAGRAVEPPVAGETWSGEGLARYRDGRRIPVLATRAPVYDEDGTLVAVISTSHDISDLKEAEEELRQSREWFRVMGETVPYGVWRCNAHGGAGYVSQSFLDLLEMTQEEQREFGWT